jgi:hypothetical protein
VVNKRSAARYGNAAILKRTAQGLHEKITNDRL